MTVALKVFPVAATVAVILVEPSITWLLVSTRPSAALITMPVPAARSLLYCSVVLMITMPWPTLFRLPVAAPDPPLLGVGTAALGSAAGGVVMLGGTAAEFEGGW